MALTEHPPQHPLAVRAVEAGSIRVNDETYTHSIILSADNQISDWDVKDVEDFTRELLQPLLSGEPEVVIIGTGVNMTFVSPELLAVFYERGVGVEVMDTAAAGRTYNLLASEGRRVSAGMVV